MGWGSGVEAIVPHSFLMGDRCIAAETHAHRRRYSPDLLSIITPNALRLYTAL